MNFFKDASPIALILAVLSFLTILTSVFFAHGCVPITQGMTVENAERTAVEVFCARMARCSEGRYDFETCIAGDYWPTPAPTMGIPNGLDRCLRFVSEQPCTEMERDATGTREDYEAWDAHVVCREEMSWDS